MDYMEEEEEEGGSTGGEGGRWMVKTERNAITGGANVRA